jgi:hypothetical protein
MPDVAKMTFPPVAAQDAFIINRNHIVGPQPRQGNNFAGKVQLRSPS